jgi:uncharacterized protein (DUF3084 family)
LEAQNKILETVPPEELKDKKIMLIEHRKLSEQMEQIKTKFVNLSEYSKNLYDENQDLKKEVENLYKQMENNDLEFNGIQKKNSSLLKENEEMTNQVLMVKMFLNDVSQENVDFK